MEAIGKIEASPFCTGRTEQGFKATFDFILQNKTLAGALEGKYDNRVGTDDRQSVQDVWADVLGGRKDSDFDDFRITVDGGYE